MTGKVGALETDPARALDQWAADMLHETADTLDALRVRLGLDVLTTDEWNALVDARSHCRLSAWRRERESIAQPKASQ